MKRLFQTLLVLFLVVSGTFAQTVVQIDNDESIPALVRNLPDWESVFDQATFAKKPEPIKAAIGHSEVIDLIDFTGGTEIATAPYDEGLLMIVEFATPQASAAADDVFRQFLEANPSQTTVYKRIGNYNAFVFDAKDTAAAGALLERISYAKTVQWLGKDPTIQQKAERYLARSTADLFISTVILIVIGFSLAVLTGIVTGYVFFRFREQRRALNPAYSDAGGLVRLNLDELTSPIHDEQL